MKKFFITIPKIFFAVLCYLCALSLSVLSGYFTIVFYSESQTGWNGWAMGGLAGMLEFIKIMLATAFPFVQYRDIKREKKVSFYLKICFVLSVMASMYFFMSGGEIERSPASNIVALLYTYIPPLEIIPLKFAQFVSTMSLSILVEAFIIFLPILAPVLFLDKDKDRKNKIAAATNFEKLKEIVTVIPERLIDTAYKKIVLDVKPDEEDEIKIVEMNKEFKLIDGKKSTSKFVRTSNTKELTYNNNTNNKNDDVFVNTSDLETVKNAILKFKNGDIAPSINELMDITGLQRITIQNAKKILALNGLIRTDRNKTFVIDEDQLN